MTGGTELVGQAPPVVAVVAGATGQLGRAVAHALAEDGHRVVVLGRDGTALGPLVASLPSASRHLPVVVDPADPGAVLEAARTIRESVGAPAVLVDAIGGFLGETGIADAPDDELDAMLEAHVRSAWNLLRAFLPDIRVAEHGRIITVSTTTAQTPGSTGAAYAASKAALEALTLAAARELAKSFATANVLVLRMIDPERRNATAPEEIVGAVRWLLSPEAAAVNGQRIPLVGRA